MQPEESSGVRILTHPIGSFEKATPSGRLAGVPTCIRDVPRSDLALIGNPHNAARLAIAFPGFAVPSIFPAQQPRDNNLIAHRQRDSNQTG